MDSLCIVIPAYNEEENIEGVIRAWYPVLSGKGEGSELVVNISGSTDSTEEKILALKTEFPAVRIMKESENSYGEKVLDLYEYAVSAGGDISSASATGPAVKYIFQTDSDGQTDPTDFPAFWELRRDFDAVIGNRSKREDGKSRRFVSEVVVLLIRIFFRTKVPDANTPFRLMKAELLNKYLDIVPRGYSMPNILFTALFSSCGEKICFKEISFGKRCGGKNTMNLRRIFRIGLESLPVFMQLGKKYGKD